MAGIEPAMVADENVTLGSARPGHSMSTHLHPRGPPQPGRCRDATKSSLEMVRVMLLPSSADAAHDLSRFR